MVEVDFDVEVGPKEERQKVIRVCHSLREQWEVDYTPLEWAVFIKQVKDGKFDLPPELQAVADEEEANAQP